MTGMVLPFCAAVRSNMSESISGVGFFSDGRCSVTRLSVQAGAEGRSHLSAAYDPVMTGTRGSLTDIRGDSGCDLI
jgi:hypothetical protein